MRFPSLWALLTSCAGFSSKSDYTLTGSFVVPNADTGAESSEESTQASCTTYTTYVGRDVYETVSNCDSSVSGSSMDLNTASVYMEVKNGALVSNDFGARAMLNLFCTNNLTDILASYDNTWASDDSGGDLLDYLTCRRDSEADGAEAFDDYNVCNPVDMTVLQACGSLQTDDIIQFTFGWGHTISKG